VRRVFLVFSFILLLYFSFGFYLATFQIRLFKNPDEKRQHPIFYDYRGVSHVVTSHSKGSALPPKILLEASTADLSFLFFTDLNLIERPYNLSGYQGNVFTFSAQKLSYLDAHILVYSANPDFYFDSLGTAHAQLHQHFSEPPSVEKKYLTVLAHPFKVNHQWRGDYPVGLDGLEVINMRHQWQERWFHDRGDFIWSVFTYPWNPQLSLLRLIKEPKRELELWDHLNQQKPTLGFLGNETTAKIFRLLGLNFTFPSYEKSFRFASNHLLMVSELTGHLESDRKKIFSSIRKGHFYMAFDAIGDPTGFAAYIKRGNKNFLMGDSVSLEPEDQLVVELPKGLVIPTTIEVFRNGEQFFRSTNNPVNIKLRESGAYRVEVKVQPKLPLPDNERWLAWIYTNPFFVKKP
jgi:hypothetical protein